MKNNFLRRSATVSLDQELIKTIRNESKLAMFNFHQNYYYFDKRSLFIFSSEWKIRKAIVWLVEWLWFKIFILLTVIANSFVIASHSYEFRIDVTKEENTKFEILAN